MAEPIHNSQPRPPEDDRGEEGEPSKSGTGGAADESRGDDSACPECPAADQLASSEHNSAHRASDRFSAAIQALQAARAALAELVEELSSDLSDSAVDLVLELTDSTCVLKSVSSLLHLSASSSPLEDRTPDSHRAHYDRALRTLRVLQQGIMRSFLSLCDAFPRGIDSALEDNLRDAHALLDEAGTRLRETEPGTEPETDAGHSSGLARAAHPKTRTNRQLSRTPALDSFGVCLTDLAEEGKLDPVVEIGDHTERVLQILGRRKKNNPILIGEAGVGKTAIAEGVAQRIVRDKKAGFPAGTRLIMLDLPLMVAGTKFRGEFEERLKRVLAEVRNANPRPILFIDEFHMLTRTGRAEGAIDAASILKPALTSGEITCIGATTFDEYQRYIQRDASLSQCLMPVLVAEPYPADTLRVLIALRQRLENHHKVLLPDAVLARAISNAQRFIPAQFFPDKAIDVIDQSAVRARMKYLNGKRALLPSIRDELISELTRAIDGLQEAVHGLSPRAAFQTSRRIVRACRAREELQAGERPQMVEGAFRRLRPAVTCEDIDLTTAEIANTSYPLVRRSGTERIDALRADLSAHVVNQQTAVETVVSALARRESGIGDPRRPIGSFLFYGARGTGMSTLIRELARSLFVQDTGHLIMLNMGEFQSKHEISRLIGAPPGHEGYDNAGLLTEPVRRNPHSIVVADHIELADPSVLNLFLHILEEGRLTNGRGMTINFRDCFIILTTTAAERAFFAAAQPKPATAPQEWDWLRNGEVRLTERPLRLVEQAAAGLLSKAFPRPEFLNRLTPVMFRPLGLQELDRVLDHELQRIPKELNIAELSFRTTQRARLLLLMHEFDVRRGAHGIEANVRRLVRDPLSDAFIQRTLSPGTIYLDAAPSGGALTIKGEDQVLSRAPFLTLQPSMDAGSNGARKDA